MSQPSHLHLRAVFFDVGDTLVFDDPPVAERFARAARAAGYSVSDAYLPDAWRQAERVGLQAHLDGTDTDAEDVQRRVAAAALAALGLPVPDKAQWRTLAERFLSVPFVRTVPAPVWAMLDNLRARGVRLGIISDWEDTLPAILQELGLLPYFETVSVSAIVGCRKPGARLFADALAQMDVPAANTLHIGDWLELDVAGARSVGMSALLYDRACRAPHADCPRVATWPALAAYLSHWLDQSSAD